MPGWLSSVRRVAAEALVPASVLVLRARTRERRVALTFDDGPDALTPAYLDVLDRFGALATFFVLGQHAVARKDELLAIVRRGHQVASHGYSHRRFPTLKRDEIEGELRATAALLPPAETQHPLLRPPQGATSLRSLLSCARAGYTTVLWSLDSDDCRVQSADQVAERVAPERIEPGAIVLLHEGQSWTLEALPRILSGLREASYAMVTVDNLLTR
ncbi:MAG TPA: polysaccharide deacetylase family protein [Polyangia bacterium]|nr:polysaccharide deacetylase family protein [Polyangia bacterium]